MKNLFAFLFIATLFSCKTDKTNNELNSCKDNALAQVIYLDIFKQSQYYVSTFLNQQNPGDTAIKFVTSANPASPTFPFTLTVVHGNSDVLCYDNKYRRGNMVIKVSAASYNNTMTSIDKMEISFSDFYLNQSNVLGKFNIVNQGLNSKNNYVFDLRAQEGIIINSNGTMSWDGIETLELTAGATTNTVFDNTYSLTGSASGKDFKGTDFSAAISSAMTVDPNCRWFITSGKMAVEPNKLDVRNLDYGNGCTGLVSVMIKEEALSFSIQ
ncbi:MAG: hypothetical protein ACKOXB_09705 [Flavobacteriales bacterium]